MKNTIMMKTLFKTLLLSCLLAGILQPYGETIGLGKQTYELIKRD